VDMSAVPVACRRTSRTTDHPLVLREGRRAAPIGPETPLTRILEFMTDKLPLYQFAAHTNKLQMALKSFNHLKCDSYSRFVIVQA
jgi:hypothetical protein